MLSRACFAFRHRMASCPTMMASTTGRRSLHRSSTCFVDAKTSSPATSPLDTDATTIETETAAASDATSSDSDTVTQEESMVPVVTLPLADVDALKAQVAASADQLLRSRAENENVRRIARQDVKNAREFSITKFAKSMLEVADNLQRAHSSIVLEELNVDHAVEAIQALHQGVVMTDTQLLKVMASHSIVPIPAAKGDVFDPHVHDCMFEFVDATCELEVGQIGQVMKPGYMLNGRVLRPAQVGTIKAAVPEVTTT